MYGKVEMCYTVVNMNLRWTNIFKSLGNINRLRIIGLLYPGQSLNVSQISRELKISIKATSKHLYILRNLDVLAYIGRHGHVFYQMNPQLPHDIHMAIRLFLH
jgi:DNA-binding transcriptional ArsR family regulator